MQIVPAVCGVNSLDGGAPCCPACGQCGKRVRPETVGNLLRDDRLPAELHGYALCLSPDCDVVYFGHRVFHKDDVKVRVWFKESDPAVPVCYCKHVTEAEITEHVAVRKCCKDINDIQEHTGANTGKRCVTENPAGT
ncbi:MAG: (2Fe-2S)-binding protein [Bacillota bacterium]